jgi:DNA-binding GntR family transcriptional regulator
VIHERRHVVARHCPGLTRSDAGGSLYAALTRRCRLTITGADDVIRAVNVSKSQAVLLRVPVGAACLLVIGTGFLNGGQPLWHEETLYRADAYEFRNQLGGMETPRPALGRIRGTQPGQAVTTPSIRRPRRGSAR